MGVCSVTHARALWAVDERVCAEGSRSLTVTNQTTASGQSTGGESSGWQLFEEKSILPLYVTFLFPFLPFSFPFCPPSRVRTSRAKSNLDQSVQQSLWGGSHMLTYADGMERGRGNAWLCICVDLCVSVCIWPRVIPDANTVKSTQRFDWYGLLRASSEIS